MFPCGALTDVSRQLLDSVAKNQYVRLAADLGKKAAGQRIEERWSFE
jgi:hypothetical protein